MLRPCEKQKQQIKILNDKISERNRMNHIDEDKIKELETKQCVE